MFKWFNKRRQNLDESMYNIENIHPKIKEIADNLAVEARSYERVNVSNFLIQYKVGNFVVIWNIPSWQDWLSINTSGTSLIFLEKKCEDGECKKISLNKDEKYYLWEVMARINREDEIKDEREKELLLR